MTDQDESRYPEQERIPGKGSVPTGIPADPMKSVRDLKRRAQAGVFSAILLSTFFYVFVLTLPPAQLISGFALTVVIAVAAIEGTFQQIFKLRRRTVCPGEVMLAAGSADGVGVACDRALEVVRARFLARVAVLAWLDASGVLSLCSVSGASVEEGAALLEAGRETIREALAGGSVMRWDGRSWLEPGCGPANDECLVAVAVSDGGCATGALCLVGPSRDSATRDDELLRNVGLALGVSMEAARQKEGLNETLSLLGATLDSTADGILVVNSAGEIQSFNSKFAEMWRIPPPVLASRSDDEALAFVLEQLEDPEGFLTKVRELYEQPEAESYDELRFKDGRVFSRTSRPQRLQGRAVGRVWSFCDITDRVRAETALRESEEVYRTLVENASDGIFAIGMDDRFISVNAAIERILGYTREELLGMHVSQVIAPEYQELADAMTELKLAEGGRTTYEMEVVSRDGSVIPLEVSSWLVIRDGETVAVQGIARDVTERRLAEKALRESEEMYRTLVETSPDAILLMEPDGKILKANPPNAELLGFSDPASVVGLNAMDFIAEEDRERVREQVRPGGAGAGQSIEYTLVQADGRRIPIELRVSSVRDSRGNVKNLIAVARDITERRRAEEAIRLNEERYRELFDNATDIIYTHDLAGRFLSINRAAERITGYSSEEAIGTSIAQIVAPEHLQKAAEAIRRKIQEGGETTYELDIISKDGRRIPLEVSTRIIYEDGKPAAIQGIARDISERRTVEQALLRREAILEAVSFAAGHLLVSGIDEPDGINEVLRRLGEAADVSRVYTFENHCEPGGELLTSQRYEWASASVTPQIDNPDLQAFSLRAAGFGRWEETMSRGEPIYGHVKDFPEAEREVLGAQDILSIACVPIFVKGRWWGFIGFDECAAEREWPVVEVEALKAAADLLGAAIERKQSEESLRESEEKYRELVENTNEIIYTLDRAGVVTYVSPVVEQVSGFVPEEVVGKSFVPLVHPDDLPMLMESFQRTIGGQLEPSEYRMTTKSGEYRWVRTSSRPMYEDGEVVGLRGLILDITERRRVEEALRAVAEGTASASGEEFFRSLVEHLASAVETKYAFIGQLDPEEPATVTTLAVWAGDGFAENFRYALAGTPCETVAGRSPSFYERDVQQQFPEDTLLVEMGIESYMGVPLFDSAGRALGILAVMDDKPMETAASATSIISIFAARAGAELERKDAESLQAGQGRVLEKIATGAPLTEVLEALLRLVEGQSPGLMGSVLLVNEDGTKLVHGVAPSLPASYNAGLAGGVPIGPASGSCGTAVFRGEPVVVSDIATDTLWAGGPRELALSHGLRSCWSSPIRSTSGAVVGTFAMYYREPRSPDARAWHSLEVATQIAGIAIERGRAIEALRRSEEWNRSLVETAQDVIYTLSATGELTSLNCAFETITGWEPGEWLGKNFGSIVHADDVSMAFDVFKKVLSGETVSYELRILTKDGGYVTGEFTSTPLVQNGVVNGVLGVVRDVTERKKTEEMIRQLAYHDALTGLPNRALFEDRVKVALAQAKRNKQKLAVMFLDLDRFKMVNDTLGHGDGDKLLRSVAKDLAELVREGDTVARVGGDEFTLLLPGITRTADVMDVAERILSLMKQPRLLGGHEFRVTASIGITVFPTDGADPETLMRNADTAMYRAKECGRDNYQCYTPSMIANVLERLALERDLRRALEREEFIVHYQPLADVETGRIVGMEALARWQQPERGLVFPDSFIPLAEETGVILPLGEWVLRTACRQVKKWQDSGYSPGRVAVNLSARQLQDGGLISTVTRVLDETGLDPESLQLEITEGAVLTNVDFIIQMLTELREMGVGVSVDDFGTGYSSLSYLKRFPIDGVKIDRSFVRDLSTDPNDAAIVSTIIAMAGSLKVKVIAEGVETEAQLDFLRSHSCDEFQGYLLSKPVPPRAFERLLSRNGARNGARNGKQKIRAATVKSR